MDRPSSTILLRWLILFGTPLALGILEMFHPTDDSGTFEHLLPDADRWLAIHLVQLPLFPLLALAVALLADQLQGWTAKLYLPALAVFAVFITALDTLQGIAVGVLGRYANTLSGAEREGAMAAIDEIINDPIGLWVGTIAAIGWVVAVMSVTIAYARSGAPRFAVVTLGLSAIVFGIGHVPPFGPVGMALFLAAALQIEWRRTRAGRQESDQPLDIEPVPATHLAD
jgi:hypothetical protein